MDVSFHTWECPNEACLVHTVAQLEQKASCPCDWLQIAEQYGSICACCPSDHRLAANHAYAFWLAGSAVEALAKYKEAVLLEPKSDVIYRGLGNSLVDLGNFAQAERAYRRSLALNATADTQWNLSQLLIGIECYEEGYDLAESRWQLDRYLPWRVNKNLEYSDLADNTIPLLIWSEQGLGDTLQHLRWLGPLVQMRGSDAPSIVLEVEACLESLLESAVESLSPKPVVIAKNPTGPKTWSGNQVSLLSLPRLLGGAPIPDHATWLWAEHWKQGGKSSNEAARIGVVWAAGRKLEDPVAAREYWLRSLDQESLGLLIEGLDHLGCQCVPLQFGDDRQMSSPWEHQLAGGLPEAADFAATAELVAELDLVITVDTAMAHLAGSMRKAVWLLLPFSAAPRWRRHTSESPWYPTMQLFWQNRPRDWREPIQQVITALPQWLASRGPETEVTKACAESGR